MRKPDMDETHLAFLFVTIGIIAFLYSSVGYAGASGYIAVMTLFGLAAATIRPTVLILNIGGAAGSYLGSKRFPVRTISLVLAVVLVIAGTKLIFTR